MLGSVQQNQVYPKPKVRYATWFIHLQKMAKLLADFFVFAQLCSIDAGMVDKLILLYKNLVQYSSLNDSNWL